MAIHIAGTSLHNMKETVYDARNAHDRNVEIRSNMVDTMLYNIQAGSYSGRTFIDDFPVMSMVEKDICGW